MNRDVSGVSAELLEEVGLSNGAITETIAAIARELPGGAAQPRRTTAGEAWLD